MIRSHACHSFQIGPLLSTCIDACQRGCEEIRGVQEQRENSKSTLEVTFKDKADPRSSLTQADTASQRAIVQSLRAAWGSSLNIVGEEDLDLQDVNNEEEGETIPLRKDLLEDDIGETDELDPNDVTVFVDPLDGTREFVEGRLENCQVLVGIAIGGKAVAGAVGIPFPTGQNLTTDATIVYGLDGLGTGTIGAPLTRGPWPLDHNIDGVNKPSPHYACGDMPADVIVAATESLERNFGGSTQRNYGGAGNRILGAALGEVACSLTHKFGGAWDVCAPEAVAKAMGAEMTDLFGEPIDMYRKDAPKHNNARGFVVSPVGSDHKRIVAAIKTAPGVQEYRAKLL